MKWLIRHSWRITSSLLILAIGYGLGRLPQPARPDPAGTALKRPAPGGGAGPKVVVAEATLAERWDQAWDRLLAQPRSPATDKEMALALEKLAMSDPARALEIAKQEHNRQRRGEWICAVLRGWAMVSPEAAMAWVPNLAAAEREPAEQAVMDGAVRDPIRAVALAEKLVHDDPESARLRANQLLRVLNASGDFERGVDFVLRLPEQIRPEMLGTAFQYWALSQPERAFAEAVKFPAGAARDTALEAAVSGWAQGDPSGLADYALKLSSVDDRTTVLQTALREWVMQNPKAASAWIDQFDPKPELDAGAAAVATHPDVVARQPEIAASWAESITKPELRSNTLANVLREWSVKDGAAALNYARNSTALLAADRAAVLAELSASQSAP